MAMSEDHKAALAAGRKQARTVRAYLEALASRRPGRPVTAETLQARIERIDRNLATETDALRRLELTQARIDAHDALKSASVAVDIDEFARGFAATARAYGEQKGIGYAAWREAGVPALVLKQAGIKQTRNRKP